MRKLGLLGCFVFLSIMIAMSVTAGTLDGLTPAEETICDTLREDGVTKGLYGLCVAFCEAQDLASEQTVLSYEDLVALGVDAPSGRILANYNKKKQEGDPGMPCIVEEPPCPCFTQEELQSIDGWNDVGNYSLVEIIRLYSDRYSKLLESEDSNIMHEWPRRDLQSATTFRMDDYRNGYYSGEIYFCSYTNTQPIPPIYRSLSTDQQTLSVSQWEACNSMIEKEVLEH